MVNLEEVRSVAMALPEVTEKTGTTVSWAVGGKSFAWERPFSKADLRRLGSNAPKGTILALRVENLIAKDELLETGPAALFTIPHFEGFPAVLMELEMIKLDELKSLVRSAWLIMAPKRLAAAHLMDARDELD
jgi:hypothetical protein